MDSCFGLIRPHQHGIAVGHGQRGRLKSPVHATFTAEAGGKHTFKQKPHSKHVVAVIGETRSSPMRVGVSDALVTSKKTYKKKCKGKSQNTTHGLARTSCMLKMYWNDTVLRQGDFFKNVVICYQNLVCMTWLVMPTMFWGLLYPVYLYWIHIWCHCLIFSILKLTLLFEFYMSL